MKCITHACKTVDIFKRVMHDGAIKALNDLKLHGSIDDEDVFNKWSDKWIGYADYVMFAPGIGWMHRFPVGFVFNLDLIQRDVIVESLGIKWPSCLKIMQLVWAQHQEGKHDWIQYIRDRPDFSKYNRGANLQFIPRMTHIFNLHRLPNEEDFLEHGSWGPPTFAEGMVTEFYWNNPDVSLKKHITSELEKIRKEFHMKGNKGKHWLEHNYADIDYGERRNKTQILVPYSIKLDSPHLLGVKCSPECQDEVAEVIATSRFPQIKVLSALLRKAS